MVEVPPVPERDPQDAVLTDPHVPERKRFCWRCSKPVGRTTEAGPGSPSGICPHCGARYEFSPLLSPGQLVAGQYELPWEAQVVHRDGASCNFPPPVRDKLRLAYDDVKKVNPKLIYASLTGYGESGPDRDRPDRTAGCRAGGADRQRAGHTRRCGADRLRAR